jgi:hypothetical protein
MTGIVRKDQPLTVITGRATESDHLDEPLTVITLGPSNGRHHWQQLGGRVHIHWQRHSLQPTTTANPEPQTLIVDHEASDFKPSLTLTLTPTPTALR